MEMDEDIIKILNLANGGDINSPFEERKPSSEAYKDFSSEPITELANTYRFNDINLELKDALRFDLTKLIEVDMWYRYHTAASDIAISFIGESGSGKSNDLLHYNLLWAEITGVPFRTSSVVWSLPEFNLMLRGMKMRVYKDATVSQGNRINIEDRPLQEGESVSLDEASDILIAGPLSMTIALNTGDVENRCRALRVARFCAGVRQILHQSYFCLETTKRDTKNKIVTSIVYKEIKDANGLMKRVNLGSVRTPYVPLPIFQHYNRGKLESIRAFGRNVGTNRIAGLISYLADQLMNDIEFQALPLKPNSARINWMQRNQRVSIFPTTNFYTTLYQLSLNPTLHDELTKKDKRLSQYDETISGEDDA